MASEVTQVPTSFWIIFGGLIGSLGTMLIGKVLDFFQEKQKHKYALQREFFNSKLKAAEELVATAEKTRQLLGSVGVIIKALPDAARRGDMQAIHAAVNDVVSQSKQWGESLNSYASLYWRAALYFDADPAGENLGKAFLEKITNAIQDLHRLKGEEIDQAKKEEEALLILNGISEAFEIVITSIRETVAEIRTEMKKYEP